jgi:lysophospholipase L1-like esterase
MKLRLLAASALLLLPALAGCGEDESLNAPDLSNNGGLLQRYVAMGNSITAGLQSAGINDSTQQRSYAAMFAAAAGTPFFVPSLAMPGCPPPFVNNISQARVGNGEAGSCALRQDEHLPFVSNVAVPSATSFSPMDNAPAEANSNALTTFILGGRTQVQAMQDAEPTFVSLWIGNNDVLGAVTSSADPGNEGMVVPVSVFQANYGAILDAIEETGAEAALIGVIDVSAIPYASLGVIYFCLKNGGCPEPLPPQNPAVAAIPFTVAASCAPAIAGGLGESSLVPWTVGVARIGAAAMGTPTSLDCALDTDVILAEEVGLIQAAVAGYNTYISQQAEQRGWAYFDPNPTLLQLRAQGQIPPFPDITTLPTGGPISFGPYISLDGLHPSTLAHTLIADSLVSAVNETYGTDIPFPGATAPTLRQR